MTGQGKKPPKFAELILRHIANHQAVSAIIGDLEEEYSAIAENKGESFALLWYWKLVIISIPSFIKNRLYWSMAMLKNYFKIALRNLLRNRLSAFINILGLSVGLACFILISIWVHDELSFDRFFENKDDLFLLTIEHPHGVLDRNVPYALAPLLASEYPEIINHTKIYELGELTSCTLKYQPEEGPQVGYYENDFNLVDKSFFDMFSFRFVYGNPENSLQDPNSLVMSEEMAAKYFGEENPLGKKLTFNNRTDLIVTGVVHIPNNSHLQLDFVAPPDGDMIDDWNWRDPAYLQLGKNVNRKEFREKIAASLNESYPQPLQGVFKVDILPITDVHLQFGRRIYVYIFSLIAVFILFIASINYMNLATASSTNRAREAGLRKTVGAQKSQLIIQFLGESLMMSVLAFILSLILAKFLLPILNNLTSKQLVLSIGQNPTFYIFLLGSALLVGIVSGIYPAFFLSSTKPVDTLRSVIRFKSTRSLFRVVSVVGQFSISVLLIACTFVVLKQLDYARNRPLGFNSDYVVKVPNNITLLRRYSSFRNELLNNPNISFVSRGQAVPYAEDYKTSGVDWDTKDPDLMPNIRYSITDFDFIEMFEIEVIQGRSFSRDFRGDRSNFVINKEAAKYMGMENPVGQRLSFWRREGQIIGVVENYHHVSLHREIMPHIFTINPGLHGEWIKYLFIKIGSVDVPKTLQYIESTVQKFAPDFPFEYSFLDEGIGSLYESEQKLGRLFGYFAFLAIFISCLGIFGLSAFTAEKRTKEIGIRKVLGASVSAIVVLLSKEFSRWVVLANLIAWPVAYYAMSKWLENFAYRTGLNLFIFVLAGLLSLVIAALPICYQSVKAAFADPVDSLRYE